jgi:integral membrane protein (TIGR01906 family)
MSPVDRTPSRIASFVVALATAVGIVTLVIPLFLNPLWVGFEQGRAEAAAWTGFSATDLAHATDAILVDLVIGPPDFDVLVAGVPVLNEREQAHMRDVRTVFAGFFVVATVLVVAAIVIAVRRRGAVARAETWRAVRAGAVGLIIGLVVVGGIALVAFDTLFEVFHQVFFAGGSYTFDPATERLVQLFPFAFWQETAIVLGVVAIIVAAVVAAVAHRRLARVQASASLVAAPVG